MAAVTPPEQEEGRTVDLPTGTLAHVFLRAFSIQGSWNYRTMIGNGFAFALLPLLRKVHRGEALERAVARHAELFNAHPYLANLALGAVARMEAEGVDPETVRRFKSAVRGPLGGLGDALVWAGWLPVTLLVALSLDRLGTPPWATVLVFLALYNMGHLALRIWAFRTGLAAGPAVAAQLRTANLGHRTEQLARAGSFLVALLAGLVIASDPGLAEPRWLWAVLAVAALGLGMRGGHRVWRPTAFVIVLTVAMLVAVGFFLS